MPDRAAESDRIRRAAERAREAGFDGRIAAVIVEGSRARAETDGRILRFDEAPALVLCSAEAYPGALILVNGTPADPAPALFGVRLLALLGIRRILVLADADPLATGAPLGLVADHVNLRAANPLVGPNDDDFGPRFPDLSRAYDEILSAAVGACLAEGGADVSRVVAASVDGGSVDGTMRATWTDLGIDATTEGLVPTTIVARHAGLRVAALLAFRAHAPGITAAAVGAFIEAD